jgi:hypothetical protein
MARNVNSHFRPGMNGAYYTAYPKQKDYDPSCPVNIAIDTLPDSWPRKTMLWGPASLKHLYTGVPNYYPYQKIEIPIGTMYDTDSSAFGPHGERIHYGSKLYPYHAFSPREVREYSDWYLPVPDMRDMTKVPISREGYWGQ